MSIKCCVRTYSIDGYTNSLMNGNDILKNLTKKCIVLKNKYIIFFFMLYYSSIVIVLENEYEVSKVWF